MKYVLVVDDEPDIRTVIGQVLRDAGYAVRLAANGVEALDSMRQEVPHGVVLDLNMPVMGGEAFLRVCRADPALAEVPVAVISDAHNPALLAETLRVQAFIPKPFDLDELIEIVDRLFSDATAPSEAEIVGRLFSNAAPPSEAQQSTEVVAVCARSISAPAAHRGDDARGGRISGSAHR